MNEVIINNNILNKQIYTKIQGRMHKIRQRMQTTIAYYKTSQHLFKNYYRQIRQIYEQLEEGSRNSNVYFSNRCCELMSTLDKVKQIICGLEKSAILNVERLDKFNQENTIKAHNKLQTEIDKFYNNLLDYGEKSSKIEKKINDYNKEVAYVRQSINKYQNFKDPIHFYNPAEFQKSLQKLDDKFKSLQEKESILVGDVEIILINKKYLKNSMQEFKDVIFNVLYSETSCFNSMINIIVQGCKERIDEESKMYRNSSVSNELYEVELINMKKIYNKLMVNKNDCDSFHNPFPVDREVSEIDSNLKLYEQRCKNVIGLRKSYLDSSEQFVNKIKAFLSKIMKSMQKVKKSYNHNVDHVIGPSNKMQKFKKDIWQYLGERQIKKFNLSETIISSQAKAASAIYKKLSLTFKQLDKSINQKSLFFQQFKQKSIKIVQSHSVIKNFVEAQKVVDEQSYQKYQTSIRDSFLSLNELFEKIEKEEEHLYNYLLLLCKQMVNVYIKQISIVQYQYITSDQKDLFQTLKKRSQQNQILDIMNNDQRYQILYNPFFLQSSNKQKSTSCIRSQYSKMRDLLQKKNYIVNIATQYQNRNSSAACCLSKSPNDYIHPRVSSDCKLSNNKSEFINGTLKIYPECICFITKREFLKGEKMILIIPKKEIKSVEKKSITERSENALELMTEMGRVVFHYVVNVEEAYGVIGRAVEKGKQGREGKEWKGLIVTNDELNESRSRNNSFVIKNPVSTERHTPNTSVEKVRENKVLRHKKVQSGQLSISPSPSGLIIPTQQNQQPPFCLSSFPCPQLTLPSLHQPPKAFKLIKQTLSSFQIKRLYSTRILKLDYTIKQIRSISTSTSDESTSIKIKWKIECNSTSNKFQLTQKIVVKVLPEKINMIVSLREMDYLESYVGGYLKECIDEMNMEMMERIAKEYGRDCHIQVEERMEEVEHVEGGKRMGTEGNAEITGNTKEAIVYLDQRSGKKMKMEFSISEKEGDVKIFEKKESLKDVFKPVFVQKETLMEKQGKNKVNAYLLLIPISIILLKLLSFLLSF